MNRKTMVVGVVILSFFIATSAPIIAETSSETTRIEKLEERVRDIEARLAKVEAATHKQMGMMEHDQMMKGQMGSGTNSPMGQMPQQGMPQGGGMHSGGGMGDM